jgi:c-di-GMP-binding flagellar brake protein YcgR
MGTLVRVQQRNALRRAMRVDCQVVRERDFTLLASRGVDVSPSGMLVMAQERVLTGEPVIVSFRLPRGFFWFDAEGTVSRVVHGRRPGDTGRCFGIEFHTIDKACQWLLTLALRGTPPPVPKRQPRIDYAESIRLAALS